MPLFQKALTSHSHPYFMRLKYVFSLLLCLAFFNYMPACSAADIDPGAEMDIKPDIPVRRLDDRAPTPVTPELRFEDFVPVQNFQNFGGVSLSQLRTAFAPLINTWDRQGFSPNTQEQLMSFGLQYYYESNLSEKGANALSDVAGFVWALTNAATPSADMGAAQFIYTGVVKLMPQQSTDVHIWYAQHVFYNLYDAFRNYPTLLQNTLSQLENLFYNADFNNDYLPVFHCTEAIRQHYGTFLRSEQGQSQLHRAQGQVESAIHTFHQWAGLHQVVRPADHAWGFLSARLWQNTEERRVHFPEAAPVPILYRHPSQDSVGSGDTDILNPDDLAEM